MSVFARGAPPPSAAGDEPPTLQPIDGIVLITQTRDAVQVREHKRLVKIHFSSRTHSAFVGPAGRRHALSPPPTRRNTAIVVDAAAVAHTPRTTSLKIRDNR